MNHHSSMEAFDKIDAALKEGSFWQYLVRWKRLTGEWKITQKEIDKFRVQFEEDQNNDCAKIIELHKRHGL